MLNLSLPGVFDLVPGGRTAGGALFDRGFAGAGLAGVFDFGGGKDFGGDAGFGREGGFGGGRGFDTDAGIEEVIELEEARPPPSPEPPPPLRLDKDLREIIEEFWK